MNPIIQTPEAIFETIIPEAVTGIPENSTDSGYALAESTLDCFREIIDRAQIKNVFEFGSGRSTRLFLESGCGVTSLEDSQKYLDETAASIGPQLQRAWNSHVIPLTTIYSGSLPMRGWKLSNELVGKLKSAQFVLIDSPSHPPFRELALITSLCHSDRAIIVVDDANIPTVMRYCDRIAARNAKSVKQYRTHKDHGLAFFMKVVDGNQFDFGRGVLETCKGWRRYIKARNTF